MYMDIRGEPALVTGRSVYRKHVYSTDLEIKNHMVTRNIVLPWLASICFFIYIQDTHPFQEAEYFAH